MTIRQQITTRGLNREMPRVISNSPSVMIDCVPALLFHQRGSPLVGHLDSRNVRAGLGIDSVQGLILPDQGRVHVVGHVADVPDHGAYLGKI